jgi:hypothetical protein
MPLYQDTIVLDAILESVWSVISHNAEQHGTILASRRPQVLVAQTDDICYVYALEVVSGPIKKTRLNLAVTHDAAAAVAAFNADDVVTAMTALPDDGRSLDAELAQAHLLGLKQLLSPIPTAVAAKKAHEMQVKETVPLYGVPMVTLAKVWLFFVFAGGIFSAALLLALNWWNMGYRRKAVSTVVMMAVAWMISVIVILVGVSKMSFDEYVTYLVVPFFLMTVVSGAIVLWQIWQQRPLYEASVQQYGKPSIWRLRNIVGMIIMVVIGSLAGHAWPTTFHDLSMMVSASPLTSGPTTTYSDGTITIQYPAYWNARVIYDCPDGEICLLQANDPFSGGMLVVSRAEEYFAPGQFLDTSYARSFTIDGRLTTRRTSIQFETVAWSYHLLQERIAIDVMFIQDGRDLIMIQMGLPALLHSTVDPIFNTVHFTTPPTD